MKRYLVFASCAVVLVAAIVVLSNGLFQRFRVALLGYEEVPAVSTTGKGTFDATVSPDGNSVSYFLTYSDLEGAITQSHIHFGQKGVNGGITVFLCTNLGNGPAGTQPCPASPATISGMFTAADMVATANAQGIAAGEFGELVAAIRAGATYANVHTTKFPGGEVRAQILTPPSRTTVLGRSAEPDEHSGH